MAKLQLKGSVYYAPGPWGAAVPASGVDIDIIEHHATIPPSQDTIWSGTTDSDGRFSGESSEWRKMISVTIAGWTHQEPDPADVLLLTIRIRESNGGTGAPVNEVTLPYLWLGDTIPAAPAILTWRPPFARRGQVNGIDCWSFQDLARQIHCAILSGRAGTIDLAVHGPDAAIAAARLEAVYEGLISKLGELEAGDSQRNVGQLSQTLRRMKADKTALLGGVRAAAGQFARGIAQTAEAQWSGKANDKTKQLREERRQERLIVQNTAVITFTIAECVVAIICAVLGVSATNAAATSALLSILVAISVAVALTSITVLAQIPAILDAIGCDEAAQAWNSTVGNQEWFRISIAIIVLVILLVAVVCNQPVTMARTIGTEGERVLRLAFRR